jgi:hypothetical protein
VLYLALVGLLSLGIATVVRDSAAATGAVLGMLYVPPIIALFLGGEPTSQRRVERYMPTNAGHAILNTTWLHNLVISPWAALGMLAAWAAAALWPRACSCAFGTPEGRVNRKRRIKVLRVERYNLASRDLVYSASRRCGIGHPFVSAYRCVHAVPPKIASHGASMMRAVNSRSLQVSHAASSRPYKGPCWTRCSSPQTANDRLGSPPRVQLQLDPGLLIPGNGGPRWRQTRQVVLNRRDEGFASCQIGRERCNSSA